MLSFTPSSLPYLIENFIGRWCSSLILYCSGIRKNLTDRKRKDRQADRELRNQLQRPLEFPIDHQGEQANIVLYCTVLFFIIFNCTVFYHIVFYFIVFSELYYVVCITLHCKLHILS